MNKLANHKFRLRLVLLMLLCFVVTSCAEEGSCFLSKARTDQKSVASQTDAIEIFIRKQKPVSNTVTIIEASLFGPSGKIPELFDEITGNQGFKDAIGALFLLFVVIYGIMITTGMTQINTKEALVNIAKIAVIFYLVSSWEQFYGLLGEVFIEAPKELMGYIFEILATETKLEGSPSTGDDSALFKKIENYETMFESVDYLLSKLFNYRIATIIFVQGYTTITGFVYAWMLFWTMWNVAKSLFIVVVVYLVSLFARALLFLFAPIFIAFALFRPTRELAVAWLRLVFNFSLQPVVMALSVAIFFEVLKPLLEYMMQISVCSQSWYIFVLYFFDHHDEPNGVIDDTEDDVFWINYDNIPYSILFLTFYYFVADIFFEFIKKSVQLAAMLAQSRTTGGFSLNITR